MNVLVDYQIFFNQKFGGISRYFVELLSRLPDSIEFKNSLLFSDNVYLKNSDERFSKGIEIPNFRGRNRITGRLNKLKSIADIKSKSYDLFHPTYYDPYFLNYLKKPYVITVYDMIHEKFREMFPANDHTSEFKKMSIINADRVIAISQNTKDDLIDIYGLPAERIEVVHLGHSVTGQNVSTINGIPKNYILFVGQRGGYKNFDRFLKAFSIVNKKNRDVKLICTGTPFNINEQKLINDLNLNNEIFRYFVSDAELTFLYQNAICFVYPSLYEGFGIPILEAFASKCPLALSNTSCFPEIAQDGGAYFNPYDIDSIADTLSNIVSDEMLRNSLKYKGTKVLSNYSWDKMALETSNIYKSIVE